MTKAEQADGQQTEVWAMRIIVCGSRYETEVDVDFLWNWLTSFITRNGVTCVIHGGAKGVDHQAMLVAQTMGVKHHPFMADWNAHDRAAGPIRNRRMIKDGKPDLVIAFPGGKGTANMVKQARAAGLKVIEVKYPGTPD